MTEYSYRRKRVQHQGEAECRNGEIPGLESGILLHGQGFERGQLGVEPYCHFEGGLVEN